MDRMPHRGTNGTSARVLLPMRTDELFSFPNPVNEVSARLVAGGVVLGSLAAIGFEQPWLAIPLAYGFVARVLTGPTLSPLGQLVTRVITPRLGVAPKYVAGPPKRFAQGIGAVVTSTAALFFVVGEADATYVVLGLIVIAATLESVFTFCIGCQIFKLLMRVGVIPLEVCERCNDIWSGSVNLPSATPLPMVAPVPPTPGARSRIRRHAS